MTNWWNRNSVQIDGALVLLIVGFMILLMVTILVFPFFVEAATVNLVWTPATEADLAGYRIYRSDTYCSEAVAFRPVQTVGPATAASDVVGVGIYCYRITAFDLAGNESSPSNKIEIKTRRDLPVLGLAVQSVVP